MPAPTTPPPNSVLQRLADLRPGEGATTLLSAGLFAWLMCGYYVLRPTREVFGIDADPVYEYLWTGTAVCTLLITPVFGWAVSRFRRAVFVPATYLAAALLLVTFWAAHETTSGNARLWVGYGFYVFVSVLAVFATAVFWGLMADGHRDEQARRLFGLVAVGGTIGALVGSSLAGALNDVLQPRELILVGAAFYATAVVFVRPLTRRLGGGDDGRGADWVPQVGARAALDGIRLFASSRYLLLIGVFLAGQTLAGTFLYIESRAFTADVFPTRGVADAVAAANRIARSDFFVTIDFSYNAIALFVQLFLVGRLVRWIGIGAMLASLPLVNLVGFGMLAAGPSLLAYGVFEVLQRGSRFSVMKPAREMLFTVLTRDEKYKAKQFLDTAVYRSTDAMWAWTDELLRAALGPLVLKLAVLVPACAAWTGVALGLGRLNRRLRSDAEH